MSANRISWRATALQTNTKELSREVTKPPFAEFIALLLLFASAAVALEVNNDLRRTALLADFGLAPLLPLLRLLILLEVLLSVQSSEGAMTLYVLVDNVECLALVDDDVAEANDCWY